MASLHRFPSSRHPADKVDRLARLRHLPAPEKRLALMFWNHPDGEKNVAASNLNVPRSLAKLTSALREAGYAVPERGETELIETAQRLLGGYRPETLDTLLADKLAISLPLADYLGWLTELPEPSRRPLVERWVILPHTGRCGRSKDSPTSSYPQSVWATYCCCRNRHVRVVLARHTTTAGAARSPLSRRLPGVEREFGADALIHFGTHGTQEWLPGRSGLAVGDYPFLALGDLPVFYPYIQDNIGEAIQARRRGRAVIISHQTPRLRPPGSTTSCASSTR